MSRPRLSVLVPSLLGLAVGGYAAETPAATTPPATTATQGGPIEVSADHEHKDLKTDQAVGTKLDLSLKDTPQSVTVVPEALIDSTGAFSLRDTLRNVPGVTIAAGEGGVTGDSLYIRGFTARKDIYRDGMRDNGQYFRDNFNLQSVEVLKGSSAALFGRGSTGGVVNQITKKPSDNTTAELNLTGGSFGLLRAAAGVGGQLWHNDSVGVDGRLDAYVHSSDSFRDDQHVTRWGVAPSVDVKLGERTDLLLQYFHQREDSTMDYGIPMYQGRPADVPIETYYGWKDDSFQEFTVDQYDATITHKLSEGAQVSNQTRYATYDRYYRVETLGTVNYTTNQVARAQALRENNQDNLLNQTELRLKGAIADHKAQLITGLELGQENYYFKGKNATLTPLAANVSVFNPQSDSSTGAARPNDFSGPLASDYGTTVDTVALYAMTVVDIVTDLKAVLGLRWDQAKTDYSNHLGVTPPAQQKYDSSDRMFSPRAALVYAPSEALSVYASYGTAFNPSSEDYSLGGNTLDANGQPPEPEKTQNYEIGSKVALLDDRLGLGVALFRIDKVNARSVDPNNNITVLDGKQRTDGIELEATGALTDRWRVFTGVAFMHGKVIESKSVNAPWYSTTAIPVSLPIEGMDTINTPRASGNIWMIYDLGAGFSIGGGMYAKTSTYTDTSNSTVLPGYARFDATAGYETRAQGVNWKAQINVANLFDTIYWDSGAARSAYPGAPRSGQLTLGAEF